MKIEKYVIITGKKFLTESVQTFKLQNDISYSMKFDSTEEAEQFLEVPCLKNRKPKINKCIITYKLSNIT